jgi:hypothetical protein
LILGFTEVGLVLGFAVKSVQAFFFFFFLMGDISVAMNGLGERLMWLMQKHPFCPFPQVLFFF